MLAEFTLVLILYLLWCVGITGWKLNLIIVCMFYRIPKFFISILELCYPVLFRRHIKSVSGKKKIALTFDDVPYANMELILAKLNEYKMHGTFFVISNYVNQENSHLLYFAVKTGHQLGNHGSNNSMHALLSSSKLENEINECDKLIKLTYKLSHVPLPTVMVYRPGCGVFNRRVINVAQNNGYVVTLGSVYPHDPIVRSSLINYYNLISYISEGDIVILHDRTWTNEYLLDNLLKWMVNNNYESVTVDELFK